MRGYFCLGLMAWALGGCGTTSTAELPKTGDSGGNEAGQGADVASAPADGRLEAAADAASPSDTGPSAADSPPGGDARPGGTARVYAGDQEGIHLYDLDLATGGLTARGSSTAGGQPYIVAWDAPRKRAYSLVLYTTRVVALSVDPTTGAL